MLPATVLRAIRPLAAVVRHAFGKVADPKIFYGAIAAMVLVTIWGTTLTMVAAEFQNADRAAATSTLELLDTYEAQVVRNLREIDHALKVVKYAYESTGHPGVLADLRQKGLLPPDLLFVVSIADDTGRIGASTRARSDIKISAEEFARRVASDAVWINGPRMNPRTKEWELEFSRPIVRHGRADGLVTIAVEAGYFVSGYEASKLGQKGVLGIVGSDDNVFRVRRTADTVIAGDGASYARLTAQTGEKENTVVRATSQWDGVTRFSTVRLLYSFPLMLWDPLESTCRHASLSIL